MVNKIGFSNFRRFAEFPEIDFGDVTILVGGNNSGKSTIVKALLLCADNLRLMRLNDKRRNGKTDPFYSIFPFLDNRKPMFRFDGNEFHDVKIKEFSRAIHNGFVDGFLPTEMTFKFALDHFHFTIVVSGNRDEHFTTGDVECITIEDTKLNLSYTNDYRNGIMKFEVIDVNLDKRQDYVKKLYKDFSEALEEFNRVNKEGDLNAISSMSDELDKLRMQITSLITWADEEEHEYSSDEELQEVFKIYLYTTLHKNKRISYEMPLGIKLDKIDENYVVNVISNIVHYIATIENSPVHKDGADEKYEEEKKEYELAQKKRKEMNQYRIEIDQSRSNLRSLLRDFKVRYISAHAANQNTLYNTADKNDYIAQTIHGFWREKINKGDREYEFIREWIRKFEIGVDFEIYPLVPGEGYTMRIKEESGVEVPLADKGMGSIQMMILLLRIATILRKDNPFNMHKEHWKFPTIIIEEPEQNLHPKMQSKLADLFYSLAKDWGCKFLIETHSEYLVRKSQVIVAEENFANEEDLKENNTFKVYYLPNDGFLPYEMKYMVSGRFENKFGEGFFDEAGKANLITLRKEKGLK